MIRVILNEGELLLAEVIANMRQQKNREARVKDKKVDQNRSGLEINFAGICGELAVAKAFNLYPDLSVNPRSGSTDLLFPDGTRADVKTRSGKDGKDDLLCRYGKSATESDVYILVLGSAQIYDIVGWCRAEDLIRGAAVRDLRQTDGSFVKTYVYDRYALADVERLGHVNYAVLDDSRDPFAEV